MNARSLGHRWHLLVTLGGMILLMPLGVLGPLAQRLEDGLLTLTLISSPSLVFSPSQVLATSLPASPGIPWVVDALAQLKSSLMPTDARLRTGRERIILVTGTASRDLVELDAGGDLPAAAPVFLENRLLGFTDSRARLQPLTGRGIRIPAICGDGEGASRMVVEGDGSEFLAVTFPEHPERIRPGGTVVAEGLTFAGLTAPEGSLIGTVEADDRRLRADQPRFRVRLSWSPLDLDAVCVAAAPCRPPREVPAVVARGFLQDHFLGGLVLESGEEAGIRRSLMVSSGAQVLGVVGRSGFRRALVRTLSDPGFECHSVLLLRGESCFHRLRLRGGDGGRSWLSSGSELDPGWAGATVVSAPGSRRVPEGLVLGTLGREGRRWFLEVPSERPRTCVVHRPG